MLRVPVAARCRQPSLRYLIEDLAEFGVTDIPGQPAAPSASPVSAEQQRMSTKAEIRSYIRAGSYCQYGNTCVRNRGLNPMKSTSGSLP